MPIKLGSLSVDALFVGSSPVLRMYIGETLIWDHSTFTDEPKIDPTHALYADTTTLKRLESGVVQTMSVASGTAAISDSAFASSTPGTMVMVREAFPAANSQTFRVSALIKVDKVAGRYTRIGFASNTSTPNTITPDVYIGHNAGTGFFVSSHGGAVPLAHTVLAEARLVDGAWYRATLAYDNVLDRNTTDTNAGRARIMGTVEPVDPLVNPVGVPWYPVADSGRHDSVVGGSSYIPMALVARTNSALGTLRDLTYTDTLLGANDDNAPINFEAKMGDGTSATDKLYIYSKGKAAPLRVVITAGGTGVYGGMDFAHGSGRTGHPYDAFRKCWRDLADLGYTVLHSTALHEGWGADDHLTKQLEALNHIKAEFGSDVRLYYLAYSMGGASAWRAIMGRVGFPEIRAAYIVAGIAGLDEHYDNALYSQIKTRWPIRANLDEPKNFSAPELVARNTRVRLVTSTGDANVPKTTNHDLMKAKYGASPKFSELVHTGIGHFDPAYWSAQDCVDFFEGADA